MRPWLFAVLLGTVPAVLAQNLTAVPGCAQTCLSNSTASAGSCSSLDVKCLCTNAEYVNTLSCCLATNCDTADQQKAILFNIQECATVNETAPSFVGCSPLGLTSSIILGPQGSNSLLIQPSTMASSSMSMSMSMGMGMGMGMGSNSLVSTVTGPVESIATSYDNHLPFTATFNGRSSLLTGSCTSISFAMATDSMGMVTEFPQIGCSDELEGCCPFDVHQNAVLTQCPADYFTTAGACCPSGWQVYFSSIGAQTPCYTMPSQTFVPAVSATILGITVITEHVFTRKYELTAPVSSGGLTVGTKVGIAIGICGVAVLLGLLGLFLIRRRHERQTASVRQNNNIVERSFSPTFAPGPQELASPEGVVNSPGSTRSNWPMSAGSPPAYHQSVPRSVSGKLTSPQELPGSTFIHEHHPAYTGGEETQQPVTAPSSPPGSSPRKSTTSPVVSPLGSPKAI